jgi:hypothetical protein
MSASEQILGCIRGMIYTSVNFCPVPSLYCKYEERARSDSLDEIDGVLDGVGQREVR